MNSHLHAIELNDTLNKFVASTFGLSGKIPGSLSAQAKVKEKVSAFIKQINAGDDYTIDLFSPEENPFVCRIVTKLYNAGVVSFTSSVDMELKDILEKKIDVIPEVSIEQKQDTQPTTEKARIISSPEPEEKKIVKEIESKDSELTYIPVMENCEETIEENNFIEENATITSNVESEEHRDQKVININIPHDVITAIGKFVNCVNLFNIGNMVFGDTISISQTNVISEKIFEIMSYADSIRSHVPNFICDVVSNMDYRNGVFSIDVHVVLDISVQNLSSDYVMSFNVNRNK